MILITRVCYKPKDYDFTYEWLKVENDEMQKPVLFKRAAVCGSDPRSSLRYK